MKRQRQHRKALLWDSGKGSGSAKVEAVGPEAGRETRDSSDQAHRHPRQVGSPKRRAGSSGACSQGQGDVLVAAGIVALCPSLGASPVGQNIRGETHRAGRRPGEMLDEPMRRYLAVDGVDGFAPRYARARVRVMGFEMEDLENGDDCHVRICAERGRVIAREIGGWSAMQRDNPRTPRHLRPRCGAKTRRGKPCQAPVVWDKEKDQPRNGRCRIHGGLSTGPKTPEGRKRSLAALRKGRVGGRRNP